MSKSSRLVSRRLDDCLSMAATRILPITKSAASTSDLPAVPWTRVENFVGQLTHDIRNGLNALELQLTFLGEISTDPEALDEIKRLRGTLGNVTKHLQSLRSSLGTTTPYPLEYPAGDFFDDLRERFAKLFPASDGKVVWEIAVGPEALVCIDPELTLGALVELLSNALHFTPNASPSVRALVSATNERATFLLQELQPAEPEIPPDDWGRTPLLTTRRGAYGLGLFRVRRCLETQGGTFEVEYSAGQNTLTTTVTLPLVSAQQP